MPYYDLSLLSIAILNNTVVTCKLSFSPMNKLIDKKIYVLYFNGIF